MKLSLFQQQRWSPIKGTISRVNGAAANGKLSPESHQRSHRVEKYTTTSHPKMACKDWGQPSAHVLFWIHDTFQQELHTHGGADESLCFIIYRGNLQLPWWRFGLKDTRMMALAITANANLPPTWAPVSLKHHSLCLVFIITWILFLLSFAAF